MSNKKIILFLKIGFAGPVIAWLLFFIFDVGFPKDTNPLYFSLSMTATSYVIAMMAVSPFLYTKKERKVDKLLGEKSSVDDATFNLLHALEYEIKPTDDFKPKYNVTLSKQILLAEIKKAKEAGASNEMIAEYLQRELNSWIESNVRLVSDCEPYSTIIDELHE